MIHLPLPLPLPLIRNSKFEIRKSPKPLRTNTNTGRVMQSHSRNHTGCIGISIVRSASNRRDGTVMSYFSVHARKPDGRARNRKFSITRLGRPEAWRRALKFRAEHEEAVAASLSRGAGRPT